MCFNYLPEPLDLFAILGVVPVDGVPLPVVDVDLLHAAQQELQLTLVEVLKPLQRDNLGMAKVVEYKYHSLVMPVCTGFNVLRCRARTYLIESIQKCLRLLLDTAGHSPRDD